jgi:hypothetical protein
MRQRRIYVIVGALGAAALAGGLSAALAGSNHAGATRATPVSATITVSPGLNETFAPPPADAAPAMTAEQAWANWETNAGATNTSIPSNTTVQLGLFTLPVGPDCGFECENGNIVQGGMVYSALNQLAYGYSSSICPAGSSLPATQCTEWIFLDANTGEMINGVLPQLSSGANTAGQTASPSAG